MVDDDGSESVSSLSLKQHKTFKVFQSRVSVLGLIIYSFQEVEEPANSIWCKTIYNTVSQILLFNCKEQKNPQISCLYWDQPAYQQ